jgi:ABC-type hemin transport system substrate-binding protein
MAVGSDTYANDMIAVCGGANVFAFRKDRRYPIVSKEEIVEAAPGVVLLPDEPYAFVERDVEELAELPIPAAQSARIHRIDGTLISWYGPRIGRVEIRGEMDSNFLLGSECSPVFRRLPFKVCMFVAEECKSV